MTSVLVRGESPSTVPGSGLETVQVGVAQDEEGAALMLDVERARWSGLDHGDYWLREAHLSVVRQSRADGAGTRFEVARHGTTAPTAVATRAAARRRAGWPVVYDPTGLIDDCPTAAVGGMPVKPSYSWDPVAVLARLCWPDRSLWVPGHANRWNQHFVKKAADLALHQDQRPSVCGAP